MFPLCSRVYRIRDIKANIWIFLSYSLHEISHLHNGHRRGEKKGVGAELVGRGVGWYQGGTNFVWYGMVKHKGRGGRTKYSIS